MDNVPAWELILQFSIETRVSFFLSRQHTKVGSHLDLAPRRLLLSSFTSPLRPATPLSRWYSMLCRSATFRSPSQIVTATMKPLRTMYSAKLLLPRHSAAHDSATPALHKNHKTHAGRRRHREMSSLRTRRARKMPQDARRHVRLPKWCLDMEMRTGSVKISNSDGSRLSGTCVVARTISPERCTSPMNRSRSEK